MNAVERKEENGAVGLETRSAQWRYPQGAGRKSPCIPVTFHERFHGQTMYHTLWRTPITYRRRIGRNFRPIHSGRLARCMNVPNRLDDRNVPPTLVLQPRSNHYESCRPAREYHHSNSLMGLAPPPPAADLMTDDLVHHVGGFLSPSDLLAAIQVNSWWSTVCSSDVIWRRLCVSRWLLPRPERLKRSTGTTSFLELYLYLARARYLPRGKYTTKHQIVWGRGRDEGADMWMTVAHSSNCQVLSTAGTPYIQLRVVVQNLRPQPLTVDLQELEVRMKGGSEGTIFGVGPIANQPSVDAADTARIKQLAPVVLAVNGVEVYPSLTSQLIELKMFGFAVLAVNVVCNGCEFEPDFLESCSALWVPIRRMGRCTSLNTCRCGLIPDSYHRGIIRVPVVDESVIWRHYALVSNRFMVLNTRSIEDVDQFSNLLGSPVSHFSKRKRSIS